MWKCASRTIRATFNKSVSRCNTVLSTKTPLGDNNSVLKLTPVLIDRLNRFYGYYKNSCGNFSKEKKDGEDPKEKTSFLGVLNSNLFDALGWSGVIVIGYYLIQPFTHKGISPYYEQHDSQRCSTLIEYQRTLQYLLGVGLKPFNSVLPEVKAAKSRKTQQFTESASKSDINFSSLEKAHQKVIGTLSNWMGTQYMQSGKHKEALEYFKQAAEEESPAGIFNLGICHEKGLGTRQNFEMAAELYQKAADLGHATAMYNLGVFYVKGLGGVEPDVDHARELFKTAASLGQVDAKKALKMEEETLDELPENILPSKFKLNERNNETLISRLISDTLLNSTLNPLEYCMFDGGVKSSSCDSYDYPEKNLNSTQGSDSGILDLSPPSDSGLIPQI